MDLKTLIQQSHQIAKDKGWWDEGKRKSPLECLALVISEISEAVEEIRKPTREQAGGIYFEIPTEDTRKVLFDQLKTGENAMSKLATSGFKPEGEAIELADAVIRLADYCGAFGIDLVKAIELKQLYNETRGYRHGNKSY